MDADWKQVAAHEPSSQQRQKEIKRPSVCSFRVFDFSLDTEHPDLTIEIVSDYLESFHHRLQQEIIPAAARHWYAQFNVWRISAAVLPQAKALAQRYFDAVCVERDGRVMDARTGQPLIEADHCPVNEYVM